MPIIYLLQPSDESVGMDSLSSLLRKIPWILIFTGLILLGVLFLWPQLMPSVGKHGRFVASALSDQWSIAGIMETYGQAWVSVQKKMDQLHRLEEENIKLRLQNAHIMLRLEALQFGCNSASSEKTTQKYAFKLNNETGARVGRSLASIGYKLPPKLLPSQLYTLGVAYLKAKEDEKAAVIFSNLTGLEETNTYKSARNFLATGVSWYRLDNYTLAEHYFDKVLAQPEKEETIQYQAQARLWKALTSNRLNKKIKVQYWLKELIDHHPYSSEAGWINKSEGEHVSSHP